MQKKRLFVDMDGVLAGYRPFESMEQYLQKGYYISLEPVKNVVDAVKLLTQRPDLDVFILSACPEGKDGIQEKDEWLDIHLPEIKKENRIFMYIGQNKADFVKGGIQQNDYLLDDYPKNLHDFKDAGGNGIKLFNGLNGNSQKWTDSCISYKNTPSYIANAITDIMNGKKIVDRMDEVRLMSVERGRTLYIQREELEKIVEEYFKGEYSNVDDFNKRFTASDWDFVKRIAKDTTVEILNTKKYFEVERDTIKKTVSNKLSILTENINKNRNNITEIDTKFRILEEYKKAGISPDKAQILSDDIYKKLIDANTELDVWHHYNRKIINELSNNIQDFFARYQAAFTVDKALKADAENDRKMLMENIKVISNVAETVYKEQRKIIDDLIEDIQNKNTTRDIGKKGNLIDDVFR